MELCQVMSATLRITEFGIIKQSHVMYTSLTITELFYETKPSQVMYYSLRITELGL